MRIIYIKETENLDNTLKNKIILKLRRVFNIIKIEKVNEQVIYILPILKQKKISEYRVKKLVNKAIKLLENDASSTIALSKYLNSNTLFKNYLYSNNINILDGRFLFKCLINKIIEYIFKIKNKELNSGEVSLLINDFTDINKDIIVDIAKNIKTLNIITNHINKCKKIEEYLYNEFGIMLNISNNKRKSLLKSQIIINIDFPEELINTYRIYDKAIILNINDKINLRSKRFNGINSNYYQIELPDIYKLQNFDDEIVYESLIYIKPKYEEIKRKIEMDKINIKSLIGKNGIIGKQEILTN